MAEITIRISDRLLKVICALLIIFIGISAVWIICHLWSSDFFQPKYRLRLPVADISGLNIGAPVRVDGALQVGKLERIDLADKSAHPERKFELVLCLEKRYQNQILSDSTASLRGENLFGQRFVDIERGARGVPLANDAEISLPVDKETKLGEIVHSFSFSKLADCMQNVSAPPSANQPTPTRPGSPPK
jgi:ABC-type transporter Mla subunit MlaD